MTLSTVPNIAELIADTETEILRLVEGADPGTAGVYEMCRYHLGLDGSGSTGKRMRGRLITAASPRRSCGDEGLRLTRP